MASPTSEFFKDLPTLSSKIAKLVSAGKSVSGAVDSALRSGGLDVDSTQRLLFFQDLTSDSELRLFFIEECGNTSPSLAQMALTYYYHEDLNKYDDEEVKQVRAKFWEKEPLAVLLATLRNTELLKTYSPELKPHVENALQSALDKQLPLTSPKLQTLLQKSASTVTSNTEGETKEVTVDEIIASLQRLHYLVTDPTHIDVLLRRNMHSAHDIALLSRATFLAIIAETRKTADCTVKIDEAAAIRIHDHATAIDCRNQETWANILDGLKKDFNMINPASPTPDTSTERSITAAPRPNTESRDKVLAHRKYNMSEIFDLQSSPCEECCSVTGPSAYFVDLLAFLKASPCIGIGSKFGSLFEALIHRRPDLQDLELSCANSKNMLPYIAIVNEILASFIKSTESQDEDSAIVGSVKAFNEKEEKDVVDVSPLQNSEVFASDSMVNLMFPLNIFPFDQGLSAIKVYLEAVGLTALDISTTFRSEARVLAEFHGSLSPGAESRDFLLAEASVVCDRAAVAESLNLQPRDVAAIAKETIYTESLLRGIMSLRVKKGDYLLRMLEVPETHLSWGYEDSSAMLSTDESKGTGLCFIRTQFMPRSGLSFDEVLELLKTLYIGGRVVITNQDNSKSFTGQLSEMRLRALDTATKQAVGPLTEKICHDIQAFIRLKGRLGWTISQLDAALSALSESRIARGNLPSAARSSGISFELLQDLSNAKTIAELVKVPLEFILPFWASIGKHGSDSLFQRVFLAPAAVLTDSEILKSLDNRRDLITDHLSVLMTTLRLNQDELRSIIQASGIQENTAELNSDVLAQLYRHSSMCRILRVNPKDYPDVLSLLPNGTNLFHDPKTTLANVMLWLNLVDNDWSTSDIIGALRPPASKTKPSNDTKSTANAVSLTSTIIERLEALHGLWEPRTRNKVVRPEDIVQVCGELYDGAAASAVATFIEGTQITSKSIALSEPLATAVLEIAQLPPNLALTVNPGTGGSSGSLLLTLKGILSSANRVEIIRQAKDTDTAELVKLLDDLESRSSYAYQPLSERLFGLLAADARTKLDGLFKSDVCDGIADATSAEGILQIESTLKTRRTEFILAALPTLREKLVQEAVTQSIGDAAPDLEPTVLSLLATGSFSHSSTAASETIQEICETFAAADAAEELQAAFFWPTASDSYQFQLPGSLGTDSKKPKAAPGFSINGVKLPLTQNSKDGSWQSAPIMLTSGEPYCLNSSVNLQSARWSTKLSSHPANFTKSMLIPVATISSVSRVLLSKSRSAKLVKKLNLGLEEFKYFTTINDALLYIDPNDLSLGELSALETYRSLRDSVSGDRNALIAFFTWLRNPAEEAATLASRLAAATGWPEVKLGTVLELKYPGLSDSDIIARFGSSLEELSTLRAIMDSSQRLAASPGRRVSQPLRTLFQIATPTPPSQTEKDLESAAALQLCLGPGQLAQCNKEVRETQRTALVQFLLQQKHIQKLGITDPDGLFAYFMIDVQMGAQLETTRMKAAISSVQLFVQRVLLGLETSAGVLDVRMDKDKWAWMQRHNIWQATRKAFLYPENWIDPTLRDTKTALFDEYETAIMSKDFTWDTFSQAIKSYVQSLQGIADLDIAAYLRELRIGEVEIYHFFGRTRSAPFELYYRNMRIVRSESGQAPIYWSSWEKIGVEAPAYESDWDGTTLEKGGCYLVPVVRNNRLVLYLPQLLSKAQAPKPSMTLMKMAESVPSTTGECTWEVRMGWSELVDGQWTPKRMSQTPLVVEWTEPAVPTSGDEKASTKPLRGLPSVDKFTFGSQTSGSDVKIQVGYQKDGQFYQLGKFDFSDERVTATRSADHQKALGDVLDATFHKYSWEPPAKPDASKTDASKTDASKTDASKTDASKTDASKTDASKTDASKTDTSKKVLQTPSVIAYSMSKQNTETPLLAITSRDSPKRLTWTLSYAAGTNIINTATGLVTDEQKDGANGTTYFMYPKDANVKPTTVSGTLNQVCNEEAIEHLFARQMMEAVSNPKDELASLFDAMDRKLTADHDYGKSATSNYHELTTSYSIYNWELGLHTILLAVDRFLSTQQFELALKAARLVFDPTTTPPPGCTSAQAAAACWRFRPFRKIAEANTDMKDKFTGWPNDNMLKMAVSERRNNPGSAHSTARGRPQAYMKWIIMKYIEVLIASGDSYFRQGSMETLSLAIQRYVEAAHILGPEAPRLPRLGKAVVRTFKTIGSVGKNLDLELEFPFMCNIERRGSAKAAGDDRTRSSLLCILTTTYFCLPPNPHYATQRTLVQDRLYKARNNLDINGRPIVYSMSEPYINPGEALHALAGGNTGAVESLVNDADSPMPYQHFSYLINKALEYCNDLRVMGEQFLAAREKRDVEALEQIKARQDTMREKMILDIKTLEREEISKSIESLQQSRDATVVQLWYFLKLTGDSLDHIPKTENDEWQDIEQNMLVPTSDAMRMNQYEKEQLKFLDSAIILKSAAAGMDLLVGALKAIPKVETNTQPLGCGATIKMDASNFAEFTEGVSNSAKTAAEILGDASNRYALVGGFTQQLQERRLQANMLGREIKNIDKQIEMQRKRLEINSQDIDLQRREIEWAAETETWYRSKYTNEQLYAWLEGSFRGLHYDLYTLTTDTCRRAERAFRFERGQMVPTKFLRSGGYWDSNRDGLLAVDQLVLDLRRMESAYVNNPCHDWELNKNISLRKINPHAVLKLRELGTTAFSIPEMLFDMDFPGHYMRRIKSVSVSIPCVIGPYTTLPATLSLLQHSYRVSGAATSADAYLSANSSDGAFRTDPVPVYAVCTSSAVQDSGTFDLGFSSSDESNEARYGPFEGAGAISNWKLDLAPVSVQPFDYSTISDVVIHLEYTAMDGGPLLQRSATQALDKQFARVENLKEGDGLWGFLEPRNDLSNQWHIFKATLSQKETAQTATLSLKDSMLARLPFWAKNRDVRIESMTVAVTSPDSKLNPELRIPALGTVGWDKTTLGKQTLFSRRGLNKAVALKQDAAQWQLEVKKKANEVCDIENLVVCFRFVVV